MQTETIKSSHLNIRVSELSKNVLQRAAELEGDTLSHFILSQALEGAYKLLSESQTIYLSPEEQLRFFQLLENPPPINAKLSRAIERYKKVKANGSEV
ncbi:MAG: hypothetical protein BGO67_00685 [Alphaproteobacteria bacterium 41-28]|jgi:uncharacterized protein (DUF1778 family)|nr:MAG: hypothetical protein BGO67_00685 [Alphaproteobacteria bacterium 41-28]